MIAIVIADQNREHLEEGSFFRRERILAFFHQFTDLLYYRVVILSVADGVRLNLTEKTRITGWIESCGCHHFLHLPSSYSLWVRMCRMKTVLLRKLISAIRRYLFPPTLKITKGVTKSAV